MVTKLSQDTIQEIAKEVSKGVTQQLIPNTICHLKILLIQSNILDYSFHLLTQNMCRKIMAFC